MSTTFPDSPMFLDSTGQAMIAKLEAIRQAILNSGGGGGGGSVKPANYDATTAKYTGTSYAYIYGDCCSYQDVSYILTGAEYVTANAQNPPAFDSTIWETFDNIFNLLPLKPGRLDPATFGEVFNDYLNNVASGLNSHAEGSNTTASGGQSHAEGSYNTASANYSHAEGSGNTASGWYSHVEGSGNTASQSGSHAEGSGNTASGDYSHVEGSYSQATAQSSHSEGSGTRATGIRSHAEGDSSKATGNASHAEGYTTEAKGNNSHSEGYRSKANGEYSHSEGYYSEANADYSRARGYYSKANSRYSSADGYYIQTEAQYEQSVGMYNETQSDGDNIPYYNGDSDWISYAVGDRVRIYPDATNSIYQCNTPIAGPAGTFDPSKWTVVGTYDSSNPILFSVGNGDWSTRRNALEIRRDGTVKVNGNALPKPPSTDGTYTLQCTVSNGVVTYSWV